MSFAILSCETPASQSSDIPTFIDSEELEALANTIQDALNSGDVETALTYYADEANWSFPNGVEVEGKEAIGEMLKTTSLNTCATLQSSKNVFKQTKGQNYWFFFKSILKGFADPQLTSM